MLELLFEIVVEAGLQIFGEIVTEHLSHARQANRKVAAALAALGYLLLGGFLGALSLLVFPRHFIRNATARLVALAVVPLIVGVVGSLLGRWRSRRGQDLVRLDRFTYAAIFAVGLAAVRWWFAS